MSAARPVLLVAGPTASGKSALALALAKSLAGVVINADSLQVYRELTILTARPTLAETGTVPHRLYGILPAVERCSAARWQTLAQQAIAAAHQAGQLPIVTGGTGLYLRALTDGLAPIPDIAPSIRRQAQERHRRLGAPLFHRQLAALDPVMGSRLPVGDRQRLMRAWEVRQATGRSLAEWQALPPQAPPGLRFLTLLLAPPRAELYARCDRRFLTMMKQGALDEVAALGAQALDPELPAMKALGVPPLLAHIQDHLSLDEAVIRAQRDTRRYAKRQTTWFAHQKTAGTTIVTQYSESLPEKIFPKIRHFMLTAGWP